MFTLQQALNAIKNKPEFTVKVKDSYTVIDYNINSKYTFVGSTEEETTILLNLRGTAFNNETGKICRLMYHKFFNYGEQPELDSKLNFDDEHIIMEKLDGSLIAPIYYGDGFELGTRAGVTDIAMMATDYVYDHPERAYPEFIAYCLSINTTPMFEFCSRKNKVVLDYPVDALVLTGMRNMISGKYIPRESLVQFGSLFCIPVVKQYSSTNKDKIHDFIQTIYDKTTEDEGVVIRFSNNDHIIKIKTKLYCLKHKAVDGLKFEKDVLKLYLSNELDDILPLLDATTKERVEEFTNIFSHSLNRTSFKIAAKMSRLQDITEQKEFAAHVKDEPLSHIFFRSRKGHKIYDSLVEYCIKQCSSQENCRKMKELLGCPDLCVLKE